MHACEEMKKGENNLKQRWRWVKAIIGGGNVGSILKDNR